MRILVADDHILVRETITAFLHNEGIEEVREAGTLPDAVNLIRSSGAFDLVLLDYNMPGMDGLGGLVKIMPINEGRPVALMSGTASREVAEAAIKAGAAGFVPKTLGSRSLVMAAKLMASGEVFLPVDLNQASEAEPKAGLTKRESEVLRGICEGQSNKEIARTHQLQEVTIKLHVKTLFRKLNVRNRTQAAMVARDLDLI